MSGRRSDKPRDIRLLAADAQRHRHEGRDHERSGLSACCLRARADVTVCAASGWTSAGAIAAAAGGGRGGPGAGGFARLAALPDWIASGTNLFDLFQPQRGTSKPYRIFSSASGRPAGVCAGWGFAAVRSFPLAVFSALSRARADRALDRLWECHPHRRRRHRRPAAPRSARPSGSASRSSASLGRAVPANGFGLVLGTRRHGLEARVTPWLGGVIDELAGRTGAEPPLRSVTSSGRASSSRL